VNLLGAGAILPEVIAAAAVLESKWNISATVWSATSFSELQREGLSIERRNRLGGKSVAYVTGALNNGAQVTVAATDYVRAVPELVRAFVPGRYVTLGTDGFGRSDTRRALRSFFEVDRDSIVLATAHALHAEGKLDDVVMAEVIQACGRTDVTPDPWTV
jgi:pyruvate dehydrogenase E1 component